MATQRIFLGWDAPALVSAADWLVGRAGGDGPIDLGGWVVVVPGRRAGRRLTELLLDCAERLGRPLTPPRTLTVGALPELLYRPAVPIADELTCRLAWAAALRGTDAHLLQRVLPEPPAAGDAGQWDALAAMVMRLHRELAGEALTFGDVARLGCQMDGFNDEPRWRALAEVHGRYRQQMQAIGRCDRSDARLDAARGGELCCERKLCLVGLSDMPGVVRAMLERAECEAHSLVQAPETLADRFDGWGAVISDAWLDAPIDIDEDCLRVAERPVDQAVELVRCLDGFEGRYSAEQITIGVGDDQLVSYLEQLLPEFGVPMRYAAGRPVARTGPYRLLSACGEYLRDSSYRAFAALLRHPDLSGWLLTHGGEGGALAPDAVDSWLTLLDRYYADHLQGRITERWLGAERVREPLRRVYEAVHRPELLGGLSGRGALSAWAEPIAQVLRSVYGAEAINRHTPEGRAVVAACAALGDGLQQLQGLPEALDGVCGADEAIALVLRLAEQAAVPPEADEAAVEILGWLELALDDAPAMVVVGFNEGAIPESRNADVFLPNGLRSVVGLPDNDRRYARDAHALSAIVRSRDDVALIAGRCTAAGDPLTPSRLMFAVDDEAAARRVVRFYGDEPRAASSLVPPDATPAARSAFVLPPERVVRAERPFEYLRVTDFRAVLTDPYRFCLARGLGLEPLDDLAVEMDGGVFGGLAHDVLERFGRSEVNDATEAGRIVSYLDGALDRLVVERFGRQPQPAVRVQLAQMRERLHRFAEWQAGWAEAGWRIAGVEVRFSERDAALVVDGEPMYLHGKIDRIDHRPDTGEWAVFDYKTSDKGAGPDETHRTKSGRWVDLQLPLYRHLLRCWFDESGRPRVAPESVDEVKLGYLLLPGRGEADTLAEASWGADVLASADNEAAGVVRLVRGGAFTYDPERRVSFDPFAELCGVEQFADDAEAGGEG